MNENYWTSKDEQIFFIAIGHFIMQKSIQLTAMLYQFKTHYIGACRQVERIKDTTKSIRSNPRLINSDDLYNDIHFYFICIDDVRKDFEVFRRCLKREDKCLKILNKKYKLFFDDNNKVRNYLEHFGEYLVKNLVFKKSAPIHEYGNVHVNMNSLSYIIGKNRIEINFSDQTLINFKKGFVGWLSGILGEEKLSRIHF